MKTRRRLAVVIAGLTLLTLLMAIYFTVIYRLTTYELIGIILGFSLALISTFAFVLVSEIDNEAISRGSLEELKKEIDKIADKLIEIENQVERGLK